MGVVYLVSGKGFEIVVESHHAAKRMAEFMSHTRPTIRPLVMVSTTGDAE